MSTSATLDELLEFRCTQCWHSNCVSTSLSGERIACASCSAEQTVPEATPERIARAAGMTAQPANGTCLPKPEKAYEEMSDKEMQELVRREHAVPLSQMDFSNAGLASCISRLAANVVDVIIMSIAMAVGFAGILAAASLGLIEENINRENPAASLEILAILSFPILATVIAQWNLIATRGQTLGKMLMFIRIVNGRGNPPGFVQGVVLRNWLRVVLGTIPFFSLVDILFIFSDSRRCIHDYLAGTSVVQA